MSEPIKMSEEDLQALKDLEISYSNNIYNIGKIRLEKILLVKRLKEVDDLEDALSNQYEALTKSEQALKEELSKKYGTGSIDVASGMFTPTNVA